MSDSTRVNLVDQASVLLLHADAALARSVQVAVTLGDLARLLAETAERCDVRLALLSAQRQNDGQRSAET